MENEMVKVMATRTGHYADRVREEGETFEVPRSLLTAKKEKVLDADGKPTGEVKVVPPTWFEEIVEQEVKTTKAVLKSKSKDASDLT